MGLLSNLGSAISIVNPMTSGAAIFDKLSGGGLQKGFGEFTGFGGYGGVNPEEVDPGAYSDLYLNALAEMQGVGKSGQMGDIRSKLESAALAQLNDLDNNAAGRKKNFLEDQARGFAADTQNLARARGGTGNLAQALRPSGGMYDSQARATSRGLVDLQGQATRDLASLQGVQGGLYNQDLARAKGIGDVYTNELSARRGIAADNATRRYNANAERYNRKRDTLTGLGQIAGKAFGAGGGGAA